MRDGDRPTARDLLFEDGNDAAVAAENVSEPDGHILDPAILKRTDHQFGNALACPHDVRRTHGLVRRDHDKVFRVAATGCQGDVQSPEDIVLDRFKQVRLHHRHVLVSRRVIHRRWMVTVEDFGQALRVLDASKFRAEPNQRKGTRHLLVQMKERRLGYFKADDRCGPEASNLTAKLGADGSGRSGDQNGAAFQFGANPLLFQTDREAAQQVLHFYVAYLVN